VDIGRYQLWINIEKHQTPVLDALQIGRELTTRPHAVAPRNNHTVGRQSQLGILPHLQGPTVDDERFDDRVRLIAVMNALGRRRQIPVPTVQHVLQAVYRGMRARQRVQLLCITVCPRVDEAVLVHGRGGRDETWKEGEQTQKREVAKGDWHRRIVGEESKARCEGEDGDCSKGPNV